MAEILLIEDDAVMSERVHGALERLGYSVDAERDGTEGFRKASGGSYGLILLDLMLPGMDGWQICQRLREAEIDTPILMLTARGEVEDRVRGLEIGADDYLPKPFDFRELKARVKSMLRRRQTATPPQTIEEFGLRIDVSAHRATRGGREVRVTPLELELLKVLSANAGRAVSRESLEEHLWPGEEVFSNSLSFHIRSLRKKLTAEGESSLIHTVHGVGYVLEDRS